MDADPRHHVVIVGGGFGGLGLAQALRRAPVRVTLLDKRNFHLFQPLLYQVATGGLSPANIASPLRAVLQRQKNCRVLLGTVTGFDVAGKAVLLDDGTRVGYDTLVVATGVTHNYFGHPTWERHAPGLKTVEDATEIRRRILSSLELAERATDPDERATLSTFVIVGGGPTGVELAGAVAEVAHHTMRREFRALDPRTVRVLLLEGGDRVLPPFAPKLSAFAVRSLGRLGVTVRTNTRVTDLRPGAVTVQTPGGTEAIRAHVILWAAGVAASPLGKALAEATSAATDRVGRVIVERDLSVKGHPDVFVIGDLAHYAHTSGEPLPGVAPVAMQQADYLGKLIAHRRGAGPEPLPFKYWDKGQMAVLGRSSAVADAGFARLTGFPAWLAWLFVHLIYLVEFQNRLLVLLQWGWNYFTRNRSALLITEPFEDHWHLRKQGRLISPP